jgi:hypothetical protein
MTTLTNPPSAQNIVDRFADYVVATANAGIVWGTNTLPFVDFPPAQLGGTTAGVPISINGSSLSTPTPRIDAPTIYNVLTGQTQLYTNIRKLRAIKTYLVQSDSPVSSVYNTLFDQTQVAHLATSYRQTFTYSGPTLTAGSPITPATLEALFDGLRTRYSEYRDVVATYTYATCHSNHANTCHTSKRSRR